MLIPYTTNAPIYFWPFGTVAIILVNVLVMLAAISGTIADPEEWMLTWGQGLHPEQWISSLFLHGGLDHLIGNMLFLWVFGLVVEGKLGWWKFLACYLGIGVTQSMLEQMAMLGYSGDSIGSLGASSAIFGMMAMAAVWAPLNEISFFWLFMFRTGTFEVGIYMMAAFYVGWELILAMLFGGSAATSLLHLSGALVGLPLAIILLKLGVVDCEGADFFHIWSGKHAAYKEKPKPAEVFAEVDARRKTRDQEMLAAAKTQLSQYLKQRNPTAALKLYEKMKNVGEGLTLERGELVALIQTLHVDSRWQDSAPLMAEYIRRFPGEADAMRVTLAHICVAELGRPGRAIELLRKVTANKLPEKQLALARKIAAKAKQHVAEGTVELDDENW